MRRGTRSVNVLMVHESSTGGVNMLRSTVTLVAAMLYATATGAQTVRRDAALLTRAELIIEVDSLRALTDSLRVRLGDAVVVVPTVTLAGSAGAPLRQSLIPPPQKDPTLGVVLSVILPGAGQFYAHRVGKGLAILGVYSTGIALAARPVKCTSSTCASDDRSIWLVAAGAAWLLGVVSAGEDVSDWNSETRRRYAGIR
jgi:hypothetical protein